MSKHPLYFKQAGKIDPDEALETFLNYVEEKDLSLYPAQEEAVLEIFNGNNVIMNTPTGSGKSLVAEALHYSSITQRRRSFYTSPIKALVNEKFFALCQAFGPNRVGMITGDASVNATAPIICCTAEILANLALREGKWAVVHDVVMDEFHFYSDRTRGAAWQIPLLSLPQSRFLLMSATIGDTTHFEQCMTRLNSLPSVVIRSATRPVPLHFNYSEQQLDETVEQLLVEGKAPIYLVSFTQRECAQHAQNFLSLNFCTKEEKKKISAYLRSYTFATPNGKELARFLRHGIAVHHAGLLPRYRILVEKMAQQGLLKMICGTDTLGVGVNIPLRTVLFSQLCKFDGLKASLLSIRDFHQIAGRAGRKGYDDQGFVVCQAPAHVIENLKLERKAKLNPKAKKKFVKAKPPEKGFVLWNSEIFTKLQESPPETLRSQFDIDHGLLLNVLSRTSTNGCHAAKALLADCHESEKSKSRLRKKGLQLFRSLVEKNIVEFIPKEDRTVTPVRVNMDLQDDFSLTQALSLFLLDTLKFIDPMSEEYGLQIISLIESILENPKVILQRQLSVLKREKVVELKQEGFDYDERIEILETLEYPKPMADFIYDSFNRFQGKHPWVEAENIRPKSIVREMYETYQSFNDYVKTYGLERSEGLLLRHMSGVYKVLKQTVPDDVKNDQLDDIAEYIEAMIRLTDSSLLDEWNSLQSPDGKSQAPKQEKELVQTDVTKNKRMFFVVIRNQVFSAIKSLARGNLEAFLEQILPLGNKDEIKEALQSKLDEYLVDHSYIRIDQEARSRVFIRTEEKEESQSIEIEQVVLDSQNFNDWSLKLECNLEESATQQTAVIYFKEFTAIS